MSCGAVRTSTRRNDEGAVTLEFALIAPILVLLLVGIIEFGRAYSAQVSIQGAAREGARALALGEPSDAVAAAVEGAAGSAEITSISQAGCPAGSNGTSTSYASVTVNASFTFAIPFIDLGSRNMTATARMRCGL